MTPSQQNHSKPHRSQRHRRTLLLAAVALASTLSLVPSCALFHKEEEMSLLDTLELLQKLGTFSTGTTGYRVGGVISGLPAGGSVTLSLNGANAQTFTSNGPFYMSTRLGDGTAYTLSVSTQPYAQTSSVEAGCAVDAIGSTGTIPGGDVTVIYVSCGMLGWTALAAQPPSTNMMPPTGDMTIHSNGDIDVAYPTQNASVYDIASYRYGGAGWTMLATTPLSWAATPPAGAVAIELDRNGLAYLATANGMSLAVYSLGSGTWNAVGVPSNPTINPPATPSLAFRNSNMPTLTSVETSPNNFRIQEYTGATWNSTTALRGSAPNFASHPVVDSTDHVWTAVCENAMTQLTVFRDATPSSAPLFGASCTTVGSFDLAVGPDGTVYLVFISSGTVQLHKSTDNLTWTPVQTFTVASPTKAFVNVNAQGKIFVGYFDGSIFHLQVSGGNWTDITTSFSGVTPLRMRLKPDGRPCILLGSTSGMDPSVSCYGP